MGSTNTLRQLGTRSTKASSGSFLVFSESIVLAPICDERSKAHDPRHMLEDLLCACSRPTLQALNASRAWSSTILSPHLHPGARGAAALRQIISCRQVVHHRGKLEAHHGFHQSNLLGPQTRGRDASLEA